MAGAPSPGGPPRPPGAPAPTPEQQARRAKVVALLPRIVQHYQQQGNPPPRVMFFREQCIMYARTGGDLDALEKWIFTDNTPLETLSPKIRDINHASPLFQQVMAQRQAMGGGPGGPRGPGMGMGGPGGMHPGAGPGGPPGAAPTAAGPGGHSACPYCGIAVPPDAKSCPSCSAPL